MLSRVVSHVSTGSEYYHLVIHAPTIARIARPGQFLMIKVAPASYDPILRRPISIMDTDNKTTVEMLYKVVGRGTRLLSQRKADESLDIVGPLGNGFQCPGTMQTAILVGGGIGIPPLIFLAHALTEQGIVSTRAFLGARTASDLPLTHRFDKLGVDTTVATERGDLGVKGLVTEPLERFLEDAPPENPVLFACGPDPMLKAVKRLAEKRGIPAQLSLEEHMGCGIGACLGCVVDTREGYRRVCTDGPVFDAETLIKWS